MTSQELAKVITHELRKRVAVHSAITLKEVDELQLHIEVALLKKFEEGRHVGRDHDNLKVEE